MAENRDQQGTGRHPHKSTDEPWPHTKEEGTQHGKSHSSGRDDNNRSHAGGSSQARSHDSGRDNDNRSHGGSHQTQARGQDHDREEEVDLKRREYRGDDGQIHHHTRTYMEQHGGNDDKRGGDNRSHGREHATASGDTRSHSGNNRSDRGR
ncbi:MAG: hypothetical protein AB7H71_09570 [Alphaproteobacteria bacterium]